MIIDIRKLCWAESDTDGAPQMPPEDIFMRALESGFLVRDCWARAWSQPQPPVATRGYGFVELVCDG